MTALKRINSSNAPEAIGPYSHAICSSHMLYVSGQLPVNPLTGRIEAEGITAQTEQVMRNIEAILKEAGSSFERIVKTTCYLKDMKDFQAFNEVYGKYAVSLPARACFAVLELPKNALVEVECIAEVE